MKIQKAWWCSLEKDVERLLWMKALISIPFRLQKKVRQSPEGTRLVNKYLGGETSSSIRNMTVCYERSNTKTLTLLPSSKKTLTMTKKWIILQEEFL